MELTRDLMTHYLLYFCKTLEERDAEGERLNTLTDEALQEEYITEYNALQGAWPQEPLYEDQTPDIYIDF